MADDACASNTVIAEKYTLLDLFRLADDEQYSALKRTFLACGKGRKPSLPPLIVNKKLFLQLYTLKESNGKTWKQLESWFSQIQDVNGFTVRPVVEKVVKYLTGTNLGVDITDYLNQTVDLDYITSTLTAYGVSRKNFHSPPQVPAVQSEGVPNIFIIDFYKFTSTIFPVSDTLDLLFKWLCLFYSSVDKTSLKNRTECVMRKHKKLKNKGRRHPELLDAFTNSTFLLSEEPKNKKLKVQTESCVYVQANDIEENLKRLNTKVAELITENNKLSNALMEKDNEITKLNSNNVLKDIEILQLKNKLKESENTIKSYSDLID